MTTANPKSVPNTPAAAIVIVGDERFGKCPHDRLVDPVGHFGVVDAVEEPLVGRRSRLDRSLQGAEFLHHPVDLDEFQFLFLHRLAEGFLVFHGAVVAFLYRFADAAGDQHDLLLETGEIRLVGPIGGMGRLELGLDADEFGALLVAGEEDFLDVLLPAVRPDLQDALDLLVGNALILLEFGAFHQHLVARGAEELVEILQLGIGDVVFFAEGDVGVAAAEFLGLLLGGGDSCELLDGFLFESGTRFLRRSPILLTDQFLKLVDERRRHVPRPLRGAVLHRDIDQPGAAPQVGLDLFAHDLHDLGIGIPSGPGRKKMGILAQSEPIHDPQDDGAVANAVGHGLQRVEGLPTRLARAFDPLEYRPFVGRINVNDRRRPVDLRRGQHVEKRQTEEGTGHQQLKAPKDTEPMHLKKELVLADVDFSYPTARGRVLEDFTLRIAANSSVGIVGATGSGKTTTVDILLGLLHPESGALLVDGVPVTDENRRAWQMNLGYVPQQIYLADDTIAANIAFGVRDRDVDTEAVERAARMANIHDFIVSELPEGYETVVGERGVRLSGGQRQRLGIASVGPHLLALFAHDDCGAGILTKRQHAMRGDFGVAQHRLEAAGSVRSHRYMIFLVRTCRYRIHTGGGCALLVLAHQRRSSHLRNHEATIQSGIRSQERWQAGKCRIIQHGDSPFRQRPDLTNRQRQHIGGKCDRLGMEVTATERDIFLTRKHQRVIRHTVCLGLEGTGHLSDEIECGSHHLRLTSQAIRILYALVSVTM